MPLSLLVHVVQPGPAAQVNILTDHSMDESQYAGPTSRHQSSEIGTRLPRSRFHGPMSSVATSSMSAEYAVAKLIFVTTSR